jgi:hypothetical protein
MNKLSLRDLFAVVTIVALALGWWLDRSAVAGERDLYREQLRRSKAKADDLWGTLQTVYWEKRGLEREIMRRNLPPADAAKQGPPSPWPTLSFKTTHYHVLPVFGVDRRCGYNITTQPRGSSNEPHMFNTSEDVVRQLPDVEIENLERKLDEAKEALEQSRRKIEDLDATIRRLKAGIH